MRTLILGHARTVGPTTPHPSPLPVEGRGRLQQRVDRISAAFRYTVALHPRGTIVRLTVQSRVDLCARLAMLRAIRIEKNALGETKRRIHMSNGEIQPPGAQTSDKDWLVALLLAIFLGGLGVDRFYLGYIGLGILKLV